MKVTILSKKVSIYSYATLKIREAIILEQKIEGPYKEISLTPITEVIYCYIWHIDGIDH